MKIAVLGCGVIGMSWLEAFLAHDHAVQAWDPDPVVRAAVNLKFGARVRILESAEAAVGNSDFIQENGPESLLAKRQLLSRIAPMVGARTIVASSTSTLLPSDLQAELIYAERVLVGHPFNPPHILPLIEVVGGSRTAEWVIDAAIAFYSALGKHPIRLHRERLGHLANRLQAALWREAVDAVATGQARAEDVDMAVTLALGPRWALAGPFATFHLGGGQGGLAHFLEHLGAPFEALWDDAQRPVMTPALQAALIEATSRRFANCSVAHLTEERNRRLRQILRIAQAPESESRQE